MYGLIVHLVFVYLLLQFLGVDPLQAGNVVQLVLVLGLTVGWISTYIFRVSNKEMTYAQQLRDYENKVMEVSFYFILHSVLVSPCLLNVTCILVLCIMPVSTFDMWPFCSHKWLKETRKHDIIITTLRSLTLFIFYRKYVMYSMKNSPSQDVALICLSVSSD